MTGATITGRRHEVRRGGREAEDTFTVESLVIAGDDMQLGVWFGWESWKPRDTDFLAAASTVFIRWLSRIDDGAKRAIEDDMIFCELPQA